MLLALCISWLLCFALTETNTLPSAPTAYGYLARTDTKGDVLNQAPWFRFPYPGNEKRGPFWPGARCPGLPVGPRAWDGELNRAGAGFSSKDSDGEGQALGSPCQTPKKKETPGLS